MSSTTSTVSVREVQGIRDILKMRWVRNHVSHWMTHDTSKKSISDQVRWYYGVYLPGRRAGTMYGFLVECGDEVIGYGLITQRNALWWVSGGLIGTARGHGHGEFLFQTLTHFAYYTLDQPYVYLDVLANNPARKLYEKLGYREIGTEGDMVLMAFPGGQRK